MLKKVVFWMVMVGLASGLVIAAINRTNAKADHESLSQSLQQRQNSDRQISSDDSFHPVVNQRGQGGRALSETFTNTDPVYAESHGNGNGQNRGATRSSKQSDVSKGVDQGGELDWVSFEAVVFQVEEESLTLQLADGEKVLVEGRAWMYALDSGFTATINDRIAATGFFEDGEFKVGRLENISSGQAILLREASGRPMWSGRVRQSA
jgi:hypothetical protein